MKMELKAEKEMLEASGQSLGPVATERVPGQQLSRGASAETSTLWKKGEHKPKEYPVLLP